MQGDLLSRWIAPADGRVAYGPDKNQFIEIRAPKTPGLVPALLFVHGGFWSSAYDLKHAGHLCLSVSQEGVATFNIEYRRVGDPGGGWPGTFEDIRTAGQWFARTAAKYRVDLRRVVVAGHSAGGQLALWLAAEKTLPLSGVCSIAGVTDLRRAFDLKLGGGAVGRLLGGSAAQFPDRYRQASPIERVPLRVPTRLVHGRNDNLVPIELSRTFEKRARAAGDDVRLLEHPDADHFALIDPEAPQFTLVRSTLHSLLL